MGALLHDTLSALFPQVQLYKRIGRSGIVSSAESAGFEHDDSQIVESRLVGQREKKLSASSDGVSGTGKEGQFDSGRIR